MQGCSTTETEPACVWVYTEDECPIGSSDDEVGKESDPPEDPACIAWPDGTTRTLHQCHGDVTGSLSFLALGKDCPQTLGSESACQELHEFGSEPYELTRVMACCDPLDDESELDEYLSFCAADLAQQVCTSVSVRIEHLMNEGTIPKTAESLAIQKWIAKNQQECFKALWLDHDASEPGELVGSWSVPNNAAWQAVIKDFTVTIDSAAITDVTLPEDAADYIDCKDSDYNNVEIFESAVPSSPEILDEFTLASVAPISLAGPVMMGAPVRSTESLASLANACTTPWCSTASFTVDAQSGAWSIQDMNLFVNGAATVGNGGATIQVERASMRLYDTASGSLSKTADGADIYEIEPRRAHFLLTGSSIAGVGLYLLSNASSITARKSASGWQVDGFVLEHFDVHGKAWTLTLPPMNWN